MSEVTAETVAHALGGAKKNGGGWMARCPVHEDSTASLKLDDGDGGILLAKCHAGCDQAAVVSALKSMGLWPTPPAKRGGFNVVKEYSYTDEHGVLLYQVVRLDPKDFRQRKKKPGGGWDYSVRDVRQVPYRLPELISARDAGRPIFIVEGEKDADSLAALGLVATCNAGGAGKWRPEWTPLFVGATVCILPDNDPPGHDHAHQVAAMLGPVLSGRCLGELPGLAAKEDVSDWLRKGGSRPALAALFQEARKFPYRAPPPKPAAEPVAGRRAGPEGIVKPDGSVAKRKPQPAPAEPAEAPKSFRQIWAEARLDLKPSGWPRANLDNAVRILETYPALQDQFYYDEFHDAIRSTWGKPAADWYTWTFDDTLRLTLVVQRELGLHDMSESRIEQAVAVIANRRRDNPVRAWFESLQWDGVDRLGTVLTDVWGTPNDEYHRAVGRCFFVSIAARVFKPGCQVDTMPIFEGQQGIGKSQALRILGGDWFTECHEQMTSKDFFQVIQGKLIIEISELHAFKRADVEKVKGIVSNCVDRYRKSYGRDVIDHPRQCVFAGTTNRDDWHADDTGGRRFLPVECSEVNLDYLRDNRNQLFAEAAARFKRGEPWWDLPKAEQEVRMARRMVADPWKPLIRRYAEGRDRFTTEDVLRALDIPERQWTRLESMRVASVVKKLGYLNRQVKNPTGPGRMRQWHRPANGVLRPPEDIAADEQE